MTRTMLHLFVLLTTLCMACSDPARGAGDAGLMGDAGPAADAGPTADAGTTGDAAADDAGADAGPDAARADAATTDEKRWRGARRLTSPDDDRDAFSALRTGAMRVVGDAAGNALAVWSSNRNVWTSRYDAATGEWGAAESLGMAYLIADRGPPAVAMTPTGDAVVAWTENGQNVVARRHASATGVWSAREEIAVDARSTLGFARVGMGDAGDAVLAWHWRPGTPGADDFAGVYFASRFSVASGSWSAPVPLSVDEESDGDELALDVSSTGDALAVWTGTLAGGGEGLLANHYDAATDAWTGELDVPGSTDGAVLGMKLDPSGDALVLQQDVTRSPITHTHTLVRYESAADRWVPLATAPDGSWQNDYRAFAVDPNGGVLLVRAGVDEVLWLHRWDPITDAWDAGRSVATGVTPGNDANRGSGASVHVNASGEAVLVWNQDDGLGDVGSDVYASLYDPVADAWGTPEILDALPDVANAAPQVWVTPDGDVAAAWRRMTPERTCHTWANVFR